MTTKLKLGVTTLVLLAVFIFAVSFRNISDRYDETFHFVSGVLCGCWWYFALEKYLYSLSSLLFIALVTSLVTTTGTLWEILEWSVDVYLLSEKVWQPSLHDTMSDLAIDFLAGITGSTAIVVQKKFGK